MLKLWRIREIVREWVIYIRKPYYSLYGFDIDKTAKISVRANLDKAAPARIHIGAETYVAGGVLILAHDYSHARSADTYIGKRCFIGANAIILPGIILEDSTIVGAGAVVSKSPGRGGVILAGNPARIVREGIVTKSHGMIVKPEDESSII